MGHDQEQGPGWHYPEEIRYVPFPTDRANTAKAACERIAGLLNEHLLARPGMVQGAREGWSGRYRDDFDETWTTYQSNLVGIKDALYLLAGSIGTATTNAATINAQRSVQRDDYRDAHPLSSAS